MSQNKFRGIVEIELDKKRNLRFSMNALCEIEDLIGKPMSQLNDEMSIKDLRSFLWCGLKHEDKDLTMEEVGEMIELTDLGYVAGILRKALEKAMHKNGGKAGKALGAKSGTGTK